MRIMTAIFECYVWLIVIGEAMYQRAWKLGRMHDTYRRYHLNTCFAKDSEHPA